MQRRKNTVRMNRVRPLVIGDANLYTQVLRQGKMSVYRDISPTDKRNEQVGCVRKEKRPNPKVESSRSLDRS